MESSSHQTYIKLDDSNYAVWKFQVTIVLRAKKLLPIVDGTIVKPSGTTAEIKQKIIEWEEADGKAQEVLVTRVKDHLLTHLLSCKTSHEIWEKLSTIFEPKSKVSVHLIQQRFFNLKFEEPLSNFMSKIEDLSCQLKGLGEEISENMLMTKILMSLPEQYKHFVSAWESVPEKQQNLKDMTARLLVEEERSRSEESESAALAAGTSRMSSKGMRRGTYKKVYKQQCSENINKNINCFECGKPGHLRKDCYARKCHFCHRSGHLIKDCRLQKEKSGCKTANAFVLNGLDYQMWIMDTGASEHTTGKYSLFSDYVEISEERFVTVGDGRKLRVKGVGKVEVMANVGSKRIPTTLHEVLYVPDIKVNLFSVSCALDKGYFMKSTSMGCDFIKYGEIRANATRHENLYVMNFENIKSNKKSLSLSLLDWHQKLGHQNIEHVKQILNNNHIEYDRSYEQCSDCIRGKQHKQPFSQSESRASLPGELLHMDLCGPMEEESLGGSKYFLLIKDDYSSYRFIYFMRNKWETNNLIRNFIVKFEKETGYVIKKIRSDNGKEFTNKEVQEFFNKNGITHQTTVSYTPEQNGRIEREMRTIVESARTMLIQAGLEKKMWAEATATAVFIINRTGKTKENNKTPYELMYKSSFNINTLKIFGTEVYTHIPKQKRQKWDEKSEKGIFVGYGINTKGYRIWFPNTKRVDTYRDVIFINKKINMSKEKSEITHQQLMNKEEQEVFQEQDTSSEESFSSTTEQEQKIVETEVKSEIEKIQEESMLEQEGERDNEVLEINEEENSRQNTETTSEGNQRAQRNRKKPLWLKDFNLLTYDEALKGQDKDKWSEAINRELETLKTNNTWSEVTDIPEECDIISSKWVLKIKDDGQYKARLVARGFQQKCDDLEVYAPVAGLTTFRTFMAVATEKKLPVYQMDVTGAFLYGDINESVYMRLPDEKIVKLNKSIYGLKHSPRYWNEKFNCVIEKDGFVRSKNDSCLYVKRVNDEELYVLLYVDDVLYFGSNKKQVDDFNNLLKLNFDMKDLGLARKYLGITIEQDVSRGMTVMNQKLYLEKVLETFGMKDCKVVSTPLEQNFNFSLLKQESSESPQIEASCRKLIGSLLYACSATRPDLSVAVSFLSRYQHTASELLFKCLKRVLRYIKGTLSLSLVYHSNGELILRGNVDSDWAGDVKDRKSTSGFIFKLFNNTVCWSTKKQISISLSSTEAEYIALSYAITEACSLRNLLVDFGYNININILEDNQSVIKISENNDSNRRLKHIDIRYHFIVEKVSSGLVKLCYVKSEENIADLFTKPLGRNLFEKFRNLIITNVKGVY